MNLLNDGEFLAGSKWVVGYSPTSKDSVQAVGGLWLNEVGTEDTKKEMMMIDLRGAKVGDYLNANSGGIYKVVMFGLVNLIVKLKGSDSAPYATCTMDGYIDEKICIVSKHDRRWWLKDLPDADIFNDGWLAIQADEGWYWFEREPVISSDDEYYHTNGMFILTPISGIKMPELADDEWKLSKISIAELREWQDEYINV